MLALFFFLFFNFRSYIWCCFRNSSSNVTFQYPVQYLILNFFFIFFVFGYQRHSRGWQVSISVFFAYIPYFISWYFFFFSSAFHNLHFPWWNLLGFEYFWQACLMSHRKNFFMFSLMQINATLGKKNKKKGHVTDEVAI